MHPFLNTATTAARKAGRVIMRGYERLDEVKVTQKSPNDFVTDVDHKAEQLIIETLATAYPEHAFLGEESGAQGESDFVWVIDPIDGTLNFVHGFPHFCISIALICKGKVEHALIYDPVRDDLFTGSRGGGSYHNGHRMRMTGAKTLSTALTGVSYAKRKLPGSINTVINDLTEKSGGIRRSGSSALDLAYVAANKLDACYQWGMKPWDIAAGVLLVHEAGGLVLDPAGREYLASGHLLASNLKLMPQLEAVYNAQTHD
jgi:myo-inositol-1(or 4)-monophosphatase